MAEETTTIEEGRLRFLLQAPDKTLADMTVDMVVAPGAEGEMAVLPGHFDLVTCLEPGTIRAIEMVEGEDKVEHTFVVHGGFMEIGNNTVSVMADVSERLDEIDTERAKAAMKRAEERMASKSDDIDDLRAEVALRKALLRLEVTE